MKINLSRLFFPVVLSVLASNANAFDCDSDCGKAASFRYRCPTIRNPGRKCTGRDPVVFSTCTIAKEASCKVWNEAVDFFAPRARPFMESSFNRDSWAAAVEGDRETQYMTQCTAAGVAACSAVAASLTAGNPWAAAIGGGVGVFVSTQICYQSRTW